MARPSLVLILGLVLGACGFGSSDPAGTQSTYGAAIDATEAVPAPAVAAEESLYLGRVLAIDGRIVGVGADGCALRLDTGNESPLLVRSARTDNGSCTWQVPTKTDGFAVAAGMLRVADDTLSLTANGVRVTPVRLSSPDS